MTLVLLAILAVEIVILSGSGWFMSRARLGRVVTIHLVMIICFGGLLGKFGPLVSNYGNVWYAAVVAAQLMLLDRYGRQAAKASLPRGWLAVSVVFAATYPLSHAAILPGNEAIGGAVVALAGHRPQIVIASYAAFGLMIETMIITYAMLRPLSRGTAPVAAAVAAQIMDSVVFFPIAFGDLGVDFVVTAMVSGAIIKIPATLVLVAVGFAADGVRAHFGGAVRA